MSLEIKKGLKIKKKIRKCQKWATNKFVNAAFFFYLSRWFICQNYELLTFDFIFFSTTWQSVPFQKVLLTMKKVSNKWVVKWVAAQRGRVKVNSTTLFTIYAEIHILFLVYKTSSYIFYRLKGAERKHAMKGCLTETCQHSKAFVPFFTNRRHPTNQFIFFLVGSIFRINPSVL